MGQEKVSRKGAKGFWVVCRRKNRSHAKPLRRKEELQTIGKKGKSPSLLREALKLM